MIKRIVVMGASNSRASINKQLAEYTAGQIPDVEADILDLNDFEMPLFGVDRERENGIPDKAYEFKDHIRKADGVIISFAEHNGAYSTAFKNIYDWISRIEKNVWCNLPMLLLATSPGARGGRNVLEIATKRFRFSNDNEVIDFSLPSFRKNFDGTNGILDDELKTRYQEQLNKFIQALRPHVPGN